MVSELSLHLQELAQSIFLSPLLAKVRAFLYAARASRNSLQNLRKDFFTKPAQPLCAATEREFWGAPRRQGRSPSQREQTNNKQQANNRVAALRIC